MTSCTTEPKNKKYRWLDTQLTGTLKLTVSGNYEKIPLVTIKVLGYEDISDLEDKTIFEYELPLNF